MTNKCIHCRLRSKHYTKYFFCVRRKAEIEQETCEGCLYKEYKKVAKMTPKKPIRACGKKHKLTKATEIPKLVKMIVWERDNCKCIFCGKYVEWNFANSHYIKRSHNGLGIEQNIMTNCDRCHKLFEESTYREKMKDYAKGYLMTKYETWNEEMLVYKKRG